MEDQQASTMEGEEAGSPGSDVENQTSGLDAALELEHTDPAGEEEAPPEQVDPETEGEDSDNDGMDVSIEESTPEAERSEEVERESPEDESSDGSLASGDVEESAPESAEAILEDAEEQVESETDGVEEAALEIDTSESTGAEAEETEQETAPETETPTAELAATEEDTGEAIEASVEELELDAEVPIDEPEAIPEPEQDVLAETQPPDEPLNGNDGQAPPIGVELASEEIQAEVLVDRIAEPDDGRLWYVVHCYSGYENKVRHNLEQRIETMGMKDRIFDVVVPTEEEIEVKEGKRRTVERRVFPGYILVQMIMSEESWYVVRNTPGVTGFVGMGNEPTPLRPEEVSSIIKRMEADAPRIKLTYAMGAKVRIIDGPFNDFIGTVDHIDMERAKVRVMVSFFGRETPVELDFLQVEKS